jgi:succinate dehydrogenase/fumarate reductase flavoprotein subunit
MDIEEYDLVVVGFGGAGAAAALAAGSLGASVVVLEKQPRDGHTPSTGMSGGVVMGVLDADAGARYLDACARGQVPSDVNRVWARTAADLPRWLDEQGTDLRLRVFGGPEHASLQGAEAVVTYRQGRLLDGATWSFDPDAAESTTDVALGWQTRRANPDLRTGQHLMAELASALATRGRVDVRWDHRVVALLRDAAGRVAAVRTEAGHVIRARAGVVLTAGGFEFDEQMKQTYLPAGPVHFYGNPGNTGDGVRLAQSVGADLWHMTGVVGRGIAHFDTADGRGLSFNIGIDSPGYVITDRYGRRYANEYPQARQKHNFYYEMTAYDADRSEFSRIPSYWFFDERRFRERPLTPRGVGAVAAGFYDWSPDNEAEVERGWIHRGAGIADVAAAAGVLDPEQAAREVADYDAGCARGQDRLGRPAASLVPLDRPPFYCVPLYPGGSNTTGGPRRDAQARVLGVDGRPIPGLWAAGNTGAAMGALYPADGANLSEALCFGRVAGESAVRALLARADDPVPLTAESFI